MQSAKVPAAPAAVSRIGQWKTTKKGALPVNPYMRNLNRLEFVVTYACTGRCKHCSEGAHDNAGVWLGAELAASAVRDAAGAYAIASVMTFGGEPLLYRETVFAIHEAARAAGVPKRQLITNGFFAQSRRSGRKPPAVWRSAA